MYLRSCLLAGVLLGWTQSLSADVLYSVTDLGTLGGCCSTATGINDNGQVTGSSYPRSGDYEHAFLYSNGQMTDLRILPLPNFAASGGNAINDGGQVTGSSARAAGYPSFPFSHAFLYSHGQMIDLTPSSLFGYGYGINNAGQVTGSLLNFSDNAYRGFLYSNGQMTDLGTLGGSGSSVGSGINDNAQITGSSSTSTGATHAFLYSNGQMTDLGTLGGSGSTLGNGINDSAQITGSSSTSTGATHAFLYSNGQMIDLNDLIDPALGITLSNAPGINDNSQIVANGAGRAYLLTPTASVPEPRTLGLLGIPLLALLLWPRFVRER